MSGDSGESLEHADKPIAEETEGWDATDMDLSLSLSEDDDGVDTNSVIPLPRKGTDTRANWLRASENVYDHIASGSFDTAMKMLNKKV